MPLGSPVSGFQAEKRLSRGSNRRAPIGKNPKIRRAVTQEARSHPPIRRRFRKIRHSAKAPQAMMRFDGTRRTPRVFDSTKNMAGTMSRWDEDRYTNSELA